MMRDKNHSVKGPYTLFTSLDDVLQVTKSKVKGLSKTEVTVSGVSDRLTTMVKKGV